MNNILVITCVDEKQASKMAQVIHKQLGLKYDIYVSESEYMQFCPHCGASRPSWNPNHCTSCFQDVEKGEWEKKPAKYTDEYKRGWKDGQRSQVQETYPLNINDQRNFKRAKPPWGKGGAKVRRPIQEKGKWTGLGPGRTCSICGGTCFTRGYAHCPDCGSPMEDDK